MSIGAFPRHGAWADVDDTTPTRGGSRTHISMGLFLVGVAVILAGLLFGYDQGVIGGALAGIQRTFRVSTVVTEIITGP